MTIQEAHDILLDPASILYGNSLNISPPRLRTRPILILDVPEGNPRIDKDQLRIILQAIDLFSMYPKNPKRAQPLDYLHRRIRSKIEKIHFSGAKDLVGGGEIDFSASEMACMKLPEGDLKEFQLTWNEWDMVLAALAFSDDFIKNDKKVNAAADIKDSFSKTYSVLCKTSIKQRNKQVSCVRCGANLDVDKTAVDPKAYRCKDCPPVD